MRRITDAAHRKHPHGPWQRRHAQPRPRSRHIPRALGQPDPRRTGGFGHSEHGRRPVGFHDGRLRDLAALLSGRGYRQTGCLWYGERPVRGRCRAAFPERQFHSGRRPAIGDARARGDLHGRCRPCRWGEHRHRRHESGRARRGGRPVHHYGGRGHGACRPYADTGEPAPWRLRARQRDDGRPRPGCHDGARGARAAFCADQ